MAEFPALPLWTDAYLGDTLHLSTIEHGAYLLILISMWRTTEKSLPNDDRLLARYARLTSTQWARIKPILMPFFRVEGDRITQGRLTDEATAVRRLSAKQSDKAKSRWANHSPLKPLTEKEPGNAAAHATVEPRDSRGTNPAMPRDSRGNASHTHTHTHRDLNINKYPSPNEDPSSSVRAHARETTDDDDDDDPFLDLLIDRVLEAANIEAGRKWHGATQRKIVLAWRKDLGLSEPDVVDVVRDVTTRRKNGTPGSLAYFNQEMAEAAGRKGAKLSPVAPRRTHSSELPSVFGEGPERE